VTWDQAIAWIFIPGVVTIGLAVGGVWLSRYIP
jgi:xanthine/uracil/vitamin C permease (AzgA family)